MDGQDAAQVQQLNQLLKAALSSDASQRQQAEALIGELSSRESFCSLLVAVLKHPDSEESTKWLAAVQLKNTVNKRWSMHRVDGGPSRALTDQEKAYLRSEILHVVGLKDAKAALQIALVVAKVARQDYPHTWPTLLEQLLGPVVQGTADDLTSRRIWMTLHHIIKQLATKRLPADKRSFQQTTASLMPVIWTSWAADSKYMQENLPVAVAAGKAGHSPELEHRVEAWMMVTKILRRLIMNGIPRFASSPPDTMPTCTLLPRRKRRACTAQHARRFAGTHSDARVLPTEHPPHKRLQHPAHASFAHSPGLTRAAWLVSVRRCCRAHIEGSAVPADAGPSPL